MFNGVNPFLNDDEGKSRIYGLSFYFFSFQRRRPNLPFIREFGIPPSSDFLLNCFRHDELLEGHQATILNPSWSAWPGGISSSLSQCNDTQSSTRKNTRTPSFYCAHIQLCTSRRRHQGKKEAVRAFFPHSLTTTAGPSQRQDVVGPNSASSFPVT